MTALVQYWFYNDISTSLLVRTILLVITVTAVIIYFCSNLGQIRCDRLDLGTSPRSAVSEASQVLEYALRSSGARSGIYQRFTSDNTACAFGAAGPAARADPPPGLDRMPRQLDPAWDAVIFDLGKRRTISRRTDGGFVMRRPETAKLGGLGAALPQIGIYVVMPCANGAAILILSDLPLMSWGHLRLAAAIAGEVSQAIERKISGELMREAALHELRHSLARDLHDSVAQSLAGTRYWLHALREKIVAGRDPLVEIAEVWKVLDAEQANVRRLLAELRREPAKGGASNLQDDIAFLVPVLETRWSVAIQAELTGAEILVTSGLSFEIQLILSDAIAHAAGRVGAKDLWLCCVARTDTIEIAIGGIGAGFPQNEPPIPPDSLVNRVASLDGSLQTTCEDEKSVLRIAIPGSARVDEHIDR